MIGYLIYKKEEVSKDYTKWLISEFKKHNIELKLLYLEDFFIDGINEKIDFAINKTRDRNISYMLEINNIRVFNNSFITDLSNNKLLAYKHAKDNGLKFSDILIKKPNKNFIKKTVDGHGGNDVYLVENNFVERTNIMCQAFIEETVGDIRFFVVDNKIINACIRQNENNFLHNYKKGAKVSLYNYGKYEIDLINRFLEGIHCDYVGIDFLMCKNGELLFNEIEDVCGSRMLSFLGENINNTTSEFLEHVIRVLEEM